MIRQPPRSTQGVSSAASDVYKRQVVSTQSTWEIRKKVSCEDFDNLANAVNGAIANANIPTTGEKKKTISTESGESQHIATSAGGSAPTKDLNLVRELSEKVPAIDGRLDKLQKEFMMQSKELAKLKNAIEAKSNMGDLAVILKSLEETNRFAGENRQKIGDLQGDLKSQSNEINKMKRLIDVLEAKTNQLCKTLTDVYSIVDSRVKQELDQFKDSASQSRQSVLEEELYEIKKELEKTKIQTGGMLRDLEGAKEVRKRVLALEIIIETKMDKEEFEKYRIANDYNSLLTQMVKRFAERVEVGKSIRKLENRLSLLEGNFSREQHGEGELGEGAILAKKPLGGWSCATCQKDLINIEGVRVAYHPWQRMPPRPTERIARLGQGFSKMLSSIKPDQITQSQQLAMLHHSQNSPYRSIDEGTPPLLKTKEEDIEIEEERRPNSARGLPAIYSSKKFQL
eukprot:TRINITY_DN1599_c0_g1_i3.p1 TRINITY_DN1599_c0_g1~~TRINITY_DN1599_c0_g1_i3.p1  ORF type:complete len:456 (+),score=101.47 TRINITY_DN1599_c0_g1_i3:82-1449(+)